MSAAAPESLKHWIDSIIVLGMDTTDIVYLYI